MPEGWILQISLLTRQIQLSYNEDFLGEDGEYSYLPYDSEYAKIQSGEL